MATRLRLLSSLAAQCRAGAAALDSCSISTLKGSHPSLLRMQDGRWFSSLPPFTELRMPALSPTMSHGNIVSWAVKEGDEIAPGDSLAEVETDKATLTWENQDDGFVARLLVPEGSKDISVGTAVALLVEEADQVAAMAGYAPPPPPPPPQQQQQQAAAAPRLPQPAGAAAAAAAAAAKKPQPGAKYVDLPNSQVRKIIAKRLMESKAGIPHMYVSADVGMQGVEDARRALKAQGKKVSVNDFVVRAAALALADCPSSNSYWDEAQGRPAPFSSVDVCVAVATPGGLITPIVRGADKKSLFEVSAEVRELAGRARANKLLPEEFTGGSFTISNLGMFGVDRFVAIINPPQAAIMAVGGSSQRVRMAPGGGGSLVSSPVMTVTLSVDNRVYDGATCDGFLAAFKARMESPLTLFM